MRNLAGAHTQLKKISAFVFSSKRRRILPNSYLSKTEMPLFKHIATRTQRVPWRRATDGSFSWHGMYQTGNMAFKTLVSSKRLFDGNFFFQLRRGMFASSCFRGEKYSEYFLGYTVLYMQDYYLHYSFCSEH